MRLIDRFRLLSLIEGRVANGAGYLEQRPPFMDRLAEVCSFELIHGNVTSEGLGEHHRTLRVHLTKEGVVLLILSIPWRFLLQSQLLLRLFVVSVH